MNSVINKLLSASVQSFLTEHQSDNLTQLLLRHKSVLGLPAPVIVDQIAGRRKAKVKLPSWYNNSHIIYPPSINVEQSSSEETACYKLNFLTKEFARSPQSMLDLTGGFGVDSFFLGNLFQEVHFLETDKNLLKIAEHNHHALGALNFHYHNDSAEEFLRTTNQIFDFVYIDPSRRIKGDQKTISLTQGQPDIVALQDRIWQITGKLLIKTSPLLDIQKGVADLKYVKRVVVVSVENECKELLFFCEKNTAEEPLLECVDIGDEIYSLKFYFSDEKKAEINYSNPLTYLYEPNSSILKCGAFKTIAKIFNIDKLHPNTHLYTSDRLVEDFPGRTYEIELLTKPDPKLLKKILPEGRAHINTRNYPLTVEELKKKTGIKEGGEKFLIGFSGKNNKFLAVASRLI